MNKGLEMSPAEWREKKNISQEHMAMLLGITQSHYSKLESGKAKPSADVLWRFSAVTGGKVALKDFPAMKGKAA